MHPRGTREASHHIGAFRYHRANGSTHVTALRDVDLLLHTAELMRAHVITDMRTAGFTWREIGECIGLTESQTRHQYGGDANP